MKGLVVAVNYTRGLVVFEDEIGDYGYFEILGSDNLEKDEIIHGDLHCLGEGIITKESSGERIDVFIEDFGMSLDLAMEMIS